MTAEKVHQLNVHAADTAERPIVGMRWDAEGPRAIATHRHRRGQLIYTARGAVTVTADEATFVAPPHRAIWLPPQTIHAVRYPRHVAFRGLFIAAEMCRGLPEKTAVMQLDALVRELLDVATEYRWDYPKNGPEARLMRVLLDRLIETPVAPLVLPRASDKVVARVIEALEAAPGDNRPLSAWAEIAYVSERTLARRFVAETGMTFSAWRERLRIIRALEKIGDGGQITAVAFELGYSTPSNFSTMFKRVMGVPPSEYFDG